AEAHRVAFEQLVESLVGPLHDSVHLDFVRQYRKRRRLHDRVLSELLGVVCRGVSRQDEAAPTNHYSKVMYPSVQPGLYVSLELLFIRRPGRENSCRRRASSHSSASKIAGRTADGWWRRNQGLFRQYERLLRKMQLLENSRQFVPFAVGFAITQP